MPAERQQILLVKNFSGGFNDEGIGHEIINSFDRNDNTSDFYYFYVPPYGSVGKEEEVFYEQDLYKGIKIILVFDSTNITNILKLKAVVVDPVPFASFTEMMEAAKNAKYGPNNKALTEIDFKDKEFLQSLNLEEEDEFFVFPITYKVNKRKYYNLENKNIFIWHSRSGKTDNLKQESLRKFKIVYGENVECYSLDGTKLGQKNYSYNLGDDLYTWYEEKIEPLLIEENLWVLESVEGERHFEFNYSKNNILAFLDKINDENIYTNFIKGILLSNDELKNLFFSFLIQKFFGVENYQPSNVRVLTQQQSLIEEKKIINSYLRNKEKNNVGATVKAKNKLIKKYGYNEASLRTVQPSVDGQMDLYVYDDRYRVVIENKILSGINGKRETIDGQITQLDTYRTYIDDLNAKHLESEKDNKVVLLLPNHIASQFSNYKIEYGSPKTAHLVPQLTYRDLSRFFNEHQELVPEEYRSHFLNILYKQSLSREEEITNRFILALTED